MQTLVSIISHIQVNPV